MMTRDDAIDAYLNFFAAEGFGPATIDAVARASGAAASGLVEAIGDRWAALDGFTRRLDRAGLAAADPVGSVRDRLFDMTMARFDAAQPHRAALGALSAEARRRPALGVALLSTLSRTSSFLLSASGVNTIGFSGLVRVQAFAAILGDVGRVWLVDEDADQGETMRALDRRLDQVERFITRMGGADEAIGGESAIGVPESGPARTSDPRRSA